MLQVARLARNTLGDASSAVAAFLGDQFGADGGARDRAGQSDLYYTVFALEGLIALRVDPPRERITRYLAAFADGAALDLVHLCCLIRCHASLYSGLPGGAGATFAHGLDHTLRKGLAERLLRWQCDDGGCAAEPSAHEGTVYHAFLVHSAFADLGIAYPTPQRLLDFLAARARADGSFSNAASVALGNVPGTAAAVTLLRQLGGPIPAATAAWLQAQHLETGGFVAAPGAPIPDLLSTATALHALAGVRAPLDALREPCLDFIDTLWTGKAFCGSWYDDVVDSEYTYYALLALGHLAA